MPGPISGPILDAVDRVWKEPVLQKFWRHGTLVANPRGQHPYQADIPKEYKDARRWFLLSVARTGELAPEEFDNAKPPARQTEVAVYSLALSLGQKPEREWLVYAHSPRRARNGVVITVPEYGPITVDVSQSGSFYHVLEKGSQVREVIRGGPASFLLEAPKFVETGKPVKFAVSEKYSPSGKIDDIVWDFEGSGVESKGDEMTHTYETAGQYLVSVTARQAGKALVRQQVPVMVGFAKEPGLVCRLLMKGALTPNPSPSGRGAGGEGMKSWIWHGGWDKVSYTFIPDASGAGNMGFLAGGSWVKDETRGLVIELNGDKDRVEISNTPDINTGTTYPSRTIAFWFKSTGKDDPKVPASKQKVKREVLYEEGGPGAGINLYLDGDVLRAGSWNKGMGTWLDTKLADRKAWHHVAVVLGAIVKNTAESRLELFVDGVKVADGKVPLLGVHTADINLGRSGNTLFHDNQPSSNPGFYFAGRFDDLRISNRTSSAEEIRAIAK